MSQNEQFTKLIKDNEGILFKVSSIYADELETRKDLYQEMVLQLWKSYPSFKGNSKWSTWMYRIALNTAITHMRRTKKHKVLEPLNQSIFNLTESENSDLEDRLRVLYDQIKTLNQLEKAVILLFLEDKSHEEIGQITGLSVTNVGTRISRIKAKLKQKMNN